MTVIAKNSPIGLDLQLLRIQNRLDAIGWENTDVYGRLYVNERGDVKTADAHIGSGEYKEVFVDDTRNAVFGFIVDENRDSLRMIKCKVSLICSCRLDKLYETNERNDEEALLTVLNVIKPFVLIPNEGGIKTGLKNVFADISFEKFKYRDMHPYFNFAITFDLVYKA